MQRGDAVDGMAADAGEMRHAHAARARLADQRHARHPRVVAGEARPHFIEKTPVDLVDDFEMARQQLGEQRQRPGFQRLRQQGVVGVAKARHGEGPGCVPVEAAHIHQQAHQFGHADGGMGVVELHGKALGEAFDRVA